MTLKTYTSDGGFDLARLPIFFAIGIPAAILLAILYTVLSWYMPCVGFVTVALLAGYFLLMGAVLNVAGTQARNRNRWIHYLASLLVCGVGYYACWCAFFTVLFIDAGGAVNGLPSGVIWNPIDIAVYIPKIAEVGYRTVGTSNSPISGGFLWFLWFMEAVMLVLVPAFFSSDYVELPFYPRSNDWGKERKIAETFVTDKLPAQPEDFLADDTFAWMQTLSRGAGVGAVGFGFYEFPGEDRSYLTLTCGQEVEENKKKVLKQVPFLKFIELTQAQKGRVEEALEAAGARLNPAAASDNAEIEATPGWDAANPATSTAAVLRPDGLIDSPLPSFEAADAAADAASAADAAQTAPLPQKEVDPDAVAARWQSEKSARDPYATPDRPAISDINAPPPPTKTAPLAPKRPPPAAPGQSKNIGDEWDT